MDTAVVIPVYNRPRIVLDALASVAAQTLPPALLVVVDDGSTDDTAATIEQWLEKARLSFPARLVRQDNRGVSAARNRGAAEAGDVGLLAFLDSDDIWPTDFLLRMADAIRHAPEAVAASCDRLMTDPRWNGRSKLLSARGLGRSATAEIFCRYCPNPSSTLIRTTSFRDARGFDTQYHGIEDQDLFLRMSLRGRWVHVPGVRITYRKGLHTTTGSPMHLNDLMDTADQAHAHAMMLERFLLELGGFALVPRLRAAWCLAGCWHRTGKLYLTMSKHADAMRCFARALHWCPLYHRSWTRWLRTRLSVNKS